MHIFVWPNDNPLIFNEMNDIPELQFLWNTFENFKR
jgi:hypothetical protein